MLDVCFLLLIFFILTASFTAGEGILPALLPGAQPSKNPFDDPEHTVNVWVTSVGGDDVHLMVDGLNREITSFREFYVHLRRLQRTHMADGHTPVFIRPEGEVAWQHVVNAFNQASRASYENISFSKPR